MAVKAADVVRKFRWWENIIPEKRQVKCAEETEWRELCGRCKIIARKKQMSEVRGKNRMEWKCAERGRNIKGTEWEKIILLFFFHKLLLDDTCIVMVESHAATLRITYRFLHANVNAEDHFWMRRDSTGRAVWFGSRFFYRSSGALLLWKKKIPYERTESSQQQQQCCCCCCWGLCCWDPSRKKGPAVQGWIRTPAAAPLK